MIAVWVGLCLGWIGAGVGFAQSAADPCHDCGSFSGSITVDQATIRTQGSKHDRDVVAYLDRVDGPEPPLSSARTEMDQQGLVFIPHVVAVQIGTTVTFLNNDNEPHNVYFLNDTTGKTLDIGTWGKGVSVDHRFTEPATIITLCKLHLEMAAYIVVLENPWFTVAELDSSTMKGHFTINNVPPGEYELHVWHKKLKQKGGPARVSVTSGAESNLDVVITKAKYAAAPK